jgi:peptide/nickel transport system ATP-binding protein
MSALAVEEVTVVVGSGRRAFPAVDNVSLSVTQGAIMGLVGESGSGKSTLARAIVGLHPIEAGRIRIRDEDIATLSKASRRSRRRGVQMIFQDTYGSLNPRMTVAQIISEGIRHSEQRRPDDLRAEVIRVLGMVSLDERHLQRYPRELSGGQRQRVAIARVLATGAQVIIADEITSSLDVSVQAQVLNLLRDIVRNNELSMLFISHNLAVVKFLCDSVAVMHCGRIVETAETAEIFRTPKHPYTRGLLAAVPTLRETSVEHVDWIPIGEPSDPHHPPSGCRFHRQCPIGPVIFAERTECTTVDPRTGAAARPHLSACHFASLVTADARGR